MLKILDTKGFIFLLTVKKKKGKLYFNEMMTINTLQFYRVKRTNPESLTFGIDLPCFVLVSNHSFDHSKALAFQGHSHVLNNIVIGVILFYE